MTVTETLGETGRRDSWRPRGPALGLALAWLAGSVLLNAWVCDDAYITMRTAEAFLRGDGLVWNPGERVQAYTHPGWLGLLLVLRVLGLSAYGALLAAGVLCTAGFVAILARLQRPALLWPVLVVLGLSPAFVHFATSGLEAPLTHLLLGLFFFGLVRGARLVSLVLLASLLALNRMDVVLFCVLPLLVRSQQELRARGFLRTASALGLGVLPLVAWLVFSFVYYGTFVPNTAYAKLAHGIARAEVMLQGLSYLWTTLTFDPAGSALAIVGTAFALRDGNRVVVAGGAGVLSYLAYLVWIGGDFMAGRFTTPVLAVGVLLLLVSTRGEALLVRVSATPRWRARFVLVAVVLGVLPRHHVATPLSRALALPVPPGLIPLQATHWVTVEQEFYWESTALLEVLQNDTPPPHHEWADAGREMRAEGGVHLARNIGFVGFTAEGGATIVDPYALSDAFLARLPASRDFDWHVGHYRRSIPHGYLQSLRDGRCQMGDPELCELFDLVRRVTRGPLFGPERLDDILRLQRYRPSARLADRMLYGDVVPSNDRPREPVGFGDSGIDLRVDSNDPTWSALVSPCQRYELHFFQGAERVGVEQVVAERRGPHCVVRPLFHDAPFRRVRILPLERPDPYVYFGRGPAGR